MLVARLTAGALCYCAAAFVLPFAAAAAEISLEQGKLLKWLGDDAVFSNVTVSGVIEPDDVQRFESIAQKVTAEPSHAGVTLSGPGGDLIAGLSIGAQIHQRGWTTFVPANLACESVCGYIWIAGVPRRVTDTSHIGFHAAYNPATQHETGAGNAVLGSYLTKMGLSYEAIGNLTTSGPAQMTYLSSEAATKYGIAMMVNYLHKAASRLLRLREKSSVSLMLIATEITSFRPTWCLTGAVI